MTKLGKTGRGLFGLAVLGTLGLGVTQAVAEPRRGAAPYPYCEEAECNARCQAAGYMGGYCQRHWCMCSVPIQP